MIYYILSPIINAITGLILGLIVINQNRNKVNISFTLFALSTTLWSIAYFMWQITGNETMAIFWIKVLTFFSVFIPFFYFYFTLYFLNIFEQYKYMLYLVNVLALFFALLSSTSLMVNGVSEKMGFKFWPNPGIFYGYFILFFISLSLLSIIVLLIYSRKERGLRKKQIRYMVLGVGVGFLGGLTNFFLWYNIKIPPFANILVSFYVIVTFYAIAVYQLMDIKIILKKITVLVFTISFFIIFYIIISSIFSKYYPCVLNEIDFLLLFLSLLFFTAVKNYFYKFSNKYFFSPIYEKNKVINETSKKINFARDVHKVYISVCNIFEKSFHLKAFAVLKYDKKRNVYTVEYNKGFKMNKRKIFKNNDILYKIFIKENNPIIVKYVKRYYYNNSTKDVIDLLEKLKIRIFFPLNFKNKIVGAMLLGEKETKEVYNTDDLYTIKAIGFQLNSTIEHAKLYKEMVERNKKMIEYMKIATEKLRNKKKKLERLDKTKNDFILLSSHQLRNPLFVIRGYLSMLIEGTFGKNNKIQEEQMIKMLKSSESLIRLIDDLLNVERLESGRLEFNFKKDNFDEMVYNVFDNLILNAKNKGIKLYLKKPKKPLPKIKMDQIKLNQVVVNLVDNAIKYTNKGSVTISYKIIKNKLEFCVSDSGNGIGKGGFDKLFKKFSRNTGQKLHVEGTGLGLFAAKKIIENHKGKIWAKSKGVNKGSQFYFTIPIE